MHKYKTFWKLIIKHLKEDDVFHHASAITFNLIICAIPFTLLLTSIIGYVLSYQDAFQQVLRYAHQLFPSFTYHSKNDDAFNGAITIKAILEPLIGNRQVFGIIGIVILIFFSMGLFHTIKHVVFKIFEIKDRQHPIMEWAHNLFTFGLIGGVLVFLAIAISFFSVLNVQTVSLPFTTKVVGLAWAHTFIKHVFPLLFILFIFYLLFRHISETRMQRSVALVGALSFTVLFGIAKVLVGLYLNHTFFGYHLYYQGYAVIVVMGFWAFYSAALFVISTIIARSYQDVFLKKPIRENPITSIS
ncbi:MAG TPA: YihY/virulence factor BrkB family protein [Balneolaceae bacterium]|nr:YihY/virulence factor BrkB family protein [Balneolaceae bacterium]